MVDMLKDTNTYSVLNRVTIQKLQTKANRLIKYLLGTHLISETIAKKFKSYNTVAQKLYGFRKTHKTGTVSFRPIVSCINSPILNISQFLQDLLTPVTTTFYFNVRNWFEFVTFIKNVKIPDNYV